MREKKPAQAGFFASGGNILLKTRVYIDGYNFYYGCLKGTPHKWLDLHALFKLGVLPSVMAELEGQRLQFDLDTLTVKYFTAEILEKVATAPDSLVCQKSYLGALAKHSAGALEIIKGNYALNEAKAKQVDASHPQRWPRDCPSVNIWKVEEKKSDVGLALHAFKDAMLGEIEHAVIVTNDTDILPALEMINQFTRVKIGLVIPTLDHTRRPNQELRDQAIWTRTQITEAELAQYQLPRVIAGGRRPYTKPISWYPFPELVQQALDLSKARGMNSGQVFKWMQKPNPHWGNALPLDMLSHREEAQKVLDFMRNWPIPED